MTATVEAAAAAEHEVGRSRRRKEDDHLITGRTKWTDNLVLPGMLHIAILRSPLAHARITSIDTSAAKETPGVVAVYTGADFARGAGQPAERLADHAGHEVATGTVAGGRHRQLRRRGGGRRRRP